MRVVRYQSGMAADWNAFVKVSRNGTFLFERGFMDYHQHRFEDVSLLFYNENGTLIGLLPANICDNAECVQTHGGLTYGGLVLHPAATLTDVREMFRLLGQIYCDMGVQHVIYKAVPYIYHKYPAEDDRYWLFRAGAHLAASSASTAILLDGDAHAALWHRKLKKKACEGLVLNEDNEAHLNDFWAIVDNVLATRHATTPVHTAGEIRLLFRRFPGRIKLYTVTNAEGRVITGCLAFVTDTTVHIQYMEAGEEGRRRRALDWLMFRLIARYADSGQRYFDFGISTEQGGRLLNEGLVYQKEGFGGRTVCYDIYSVETEKLSTL